MISELLHTIGEVHVLRDPTRGGVSGTLNEIDKTLVWISCWTKTPCLFLKRYVPHPRC
ncbi:hypothetical protein NE573_24055 [Parabacteroides distasonis]|nr:hypothetical protein [Parabacteroides distasonis]MCQ5183094.1 hypothetical protein [Parabacteroides distasonis]